MKPPFSDIAGATVEWGWRIANPLAIATAFGSSIAAFQHASSTVVGFFGLLSAFAMCITYIASNVRERWSRADLHHARVEIERLRRRTARRALTDIQHAELVAAAKSEGPQKVWIPCVAGDHEASEYAKQLRDAFDEAGWLTGYAALQVGDPIYGLVVGMSPPFGISPTPSEIERVQSVLETAGISSTVTDRFPSQSPAFGWSRPPHPGPNAAVLLVGSMSSETAPVE